MSDAPAGGPTLVAALASPSPRLATIHRRQVHRDPWPDFSTFDPAPWSVDQRRRAAREWAHRGRNELGSVQQFSELCHALATARVEFEILGSLARLITDEVRHAQLCTEFAAVLWPAEALGPIEDTLDWPRPRAPWRAAPELRRPRAEGDPDDESAVLRWAASAILTACCLGETLSRPMLEALAIVATEPLAEAVCRQILRDEHLHATFGWEALGALLPRLGEDDRAALQAQLGEDLRGFERTVCGGIDIAEVAGCELVIERGEPNLGVLDTRQYAMIYFACVEGEIFPRLRELGFDTQSAWLARAKPR
ncbi:hypothetical protein PPSIR1_28398 [Plesiocystis pacifica SIR-1]|uniref:Ferritin-like domain-containing protein n=1 Tax=Plesiocystis pacifica SIR-1 TaxID=391625 RepID=A6FZV2_9BACT|nr:hypothetical protein [Plesiocystis pacifica]EDM80908.1 hypothetical protein PPSIR1_28398 [Plesiocystis pacifica SIR-1]